MLKTVKRISMVICVLLFNIMMVYNTGYVYAEAPQDQNFDSVPAGSSPGEYQVGDLIFTTDTGIINVRGWDALSYEFGYGRTINGFSGKAISNDPDLNTNPTYFAFESAIDKTFRLKSLYALVTDVDSSTKVDIKGYNGLSELVHVAGIDFTKPGITEYGDVTYTNNVYNSTDGEYGGFLLFGDSWCDINRVVITGTDADQPLYISLDSLDFSNLADLSIAGAPETTEGQNATFRINLTKAYTHDITVNYSIIPDSATTDDLDTAALNGTITIPANSTYGEIVVPTKDDNDHEKDESFKVFISNPSVGGILDGEATCTINDNDSPPKVSLSIDKSSIGENGGSAKITATLSNKTYENVTVNLDFSGAVEGTDFNAPTSITIPANSLSNSVDITALDDDIFSDGDKTVTVGISDVDKGSIGTFTPPELTIADDETEPKVYLNITPTSISENGIDTAIVTASLTNKSSKDVTIKLTFSGAVKDKDFTVENDTITIPSLLTTGTVRIKAIPNYKFNNDKTLTVSTSDYDVINATTGDDKSKDLTITNVDPKPTVTVEPGAAEINENDPSTTATFIVSLSEASGEDVTVDYETSDGTAQSTEDYTSTSGQLLIPKGDLNGKIEVPITNDALDEDDEEFSLTISNPVGAELGISTTTKCTIKDDDAAPSFAFSESKVIEGDFGTTQLVFNVNLSAECGKTISVDYNTEDGTATAADNDYTPVSGKLEFAAGETSKLITININGDINCEPDENFFVTLKPETGDIKAEGTIQDDDRAFIKVVKKEDGTEITNDNTVNFEHTNTGKESELEFTISNTGNSELTEDGISKLISITGSDFTIKNGPVSPIPGKGSATFSIVFKPSSTGTKTAEVTVTCKDTVNSPFKFKVTGTSEDSTGGGTTPEPPKDTIDINVGDNSLKNVAVDVKNENGTKTTTVNMYCKF